MLATSYGRLERRRAVCMADEASCAAAARLHLATTSRRESALAGVPTGCLCVERRHASNAVAAFRQHVIASLGKKATHTHKLGTPRIVRGTSLLVIPVSSEAAGFLLSPTPASQQLLAALGEHVEIAQPVAWTWCRATAACSSRW